MAKPLSSSFQNPAVVILRRKKEIAEPSRCELVDDLDDADARQMARVLFRPVGASAKAIKDDDLELVAQAHGEALHKDGLPHPSFGMHEDWHG
ncbi:hypothetical protein D3C87_1278980 [compost metagenome]